MIPIGYVTQKYAPLTGRLLSVTYGNFEETQRLDHRLLGNEAIEVAAWLTR